MISAFGVDHGYEEVEKFAIPGMKALGLGIGRLARKGATSAGQAAGKSFGAGKTATGAGQVKIGQGLKKVSNMAMSKPGAVGGAAVGGAAAGVGGAGFAMGNRRRF